SRVRGVFFAVLTQAIVLAAFLVFNMNEVKLCGTNGLTNFDRITLSSREKIDYNLAEGPGSPPVAGALKTALEKYGREHEGVTLSETAGGFRLTVERQIHVAQTQQELSQIKLATEDGSDIPLGSVTDSEIVGYKIRTDKQVKLGLYFITALCLLALSLFSRKPFHSR
ncbi:MAG: hypothetical protein GY888_31025, partial [Planctomycetaceae bacterium]|nr:hypothetical protein [Planctomycetaceae bacterium]